MGRKRMTHTIEAGVEHVVDTRSGIKGHARILHPAVIRLVMRGHDDRRPADVLEFGCIVGLVVVVEQLCEGDDILTLVLRPHARPRDGKVLARAEVAAGALAHLGGTVLRAANKQYCRR